MAEDRATLLRHTAEVVSAFLRSERVAPEQLPIIIGQVHQALTQLGQGGAVSSGRQDPQQPAVSVRRSVQPDRIICLECGRSQKTMRRPLATSHGLTPDEYRAKWRLKPDYPMVAPAYREQRSATAKQIGLGQMRGRGGHQRAGAGKARRRAPTSPASAPAEPGPT